MARVVNPTPFPEALYRKLGPGGREYEVLSVRGTFRFTGDHRPLRLAENQRPIRWQAIYTGGPEGSQARTLVEDSDVLIGKPTTDIHVSGTLRTPDGQPRRSWQIRVQVGKVDKQLRVYGPREFRQGFFGGWRLSAPAPTRAVALDYRHAFGGHIALPDTADAPLLDCPHNPVGCGWLPKRADYKRLPKGLVKAFKRRVLDVTRLPAPQLEDPGTPVRSPFDRPVPASLGPIARWWQPRLARQGTLDEAWLAERYPQWPDDFDSRYYNSAHPDLIAPEYLRGDEVVILTNCLAGSQRVQIGTSRFYSHHTRLPGLALKALAEHADGDRTITPLALDTVGIDLDHGELTLTWRALFAPEEALRRVTLAATPLPSRQSPARDEARHAG
ncbi:DUF2169 domain-containing protein [Salinicola sp. JS01]|uniref:DUF2169 family type VI secretion system accessory protein n=1 Tax=Salinicola sp. JS01 TaxID=3050071 RepID=UPI00255BC4D8|nr:DUF2169 domain-containing protein [Salinicola sp. JS01]WIX32093.1 DUF2169 domain-containing protein [Salinicola sp. JS01]